MEAKMTFTKKDVIVVAGCVVFLIVNIGAIGSGGRKRAKEAVCQSNLRQWGAIFEAYTNDNEGSFPLGYLGTSAPQTDPKSFYSHWLVATRGYISDKKIFLCPMATKPRAEVITPIYLEAIGRTLLAWGRLPFFPGYPTGGDLGSYGINGWVHNPAPDSLRCAQGILPCDWHWRTTSAKNAGTIPLMLDCMWMEAWPLQTDPCPPIPDMPDTTSTGGAMSNFCMDRHSGAINGLFLDFSVRKVGLKELWKLKWHRNFDVDAPSPVWPEWMKNFQD